MFSSAPGHETHILRRVRNERTRHSPTHCVCRGPGIRRGGNRGGRVGVASGRRFAVRRFGAGLVLLRTVSLPVRVRRRHPLALLETDADNARCVDAGGGRWDLIVYYG
ncbi:hypothetical protein Ate01nite_37350 [Actinoplanes teichomyceticus]|nr:hypothetical protein Ate01nite_37350 [Actinoplanes teichomyceticus]